MRISFSEVQRNVSELGNRSKYTVDILYELMAAYGRSASSITKLRNGTTNLAEDKELTKIQRGVVYFKIVTDFKSLPSEVEKLEQDPLTQRYNPRFLIATNLKTFAAKDNKKGNTLEIAWSDIDRNVDFFYGWTGDEVVDEKTEAVADRRAADKMKELYKEVEKVNLDKFKNPKSKFRHHLNVFFTRLLFCLFAEDTRVFTKEEDNIFTNAIKDFTQIDGSDLDEFLSNLFESLDDEDKSKYTSPFSKFPYVNGNLFNKNFAIEIPKFNAQARKLILDCGSLSWAEINPDIFGSMFQGIVDEEHRSTHGMHYTSVPNIMKTIEPLLLDELREEFDKNYDNPKKLIKLHDRVSNIKIFDPACGSGNFLIIAYKELRKLEHGIIERLFEDEYHAKQLKNKLQSRIDLNNFYGIEIDDFACETAVLSLYLAKHQMNIEFEKQFGKEIKLIPLKDKAKIVHGNAARLDWQRVCPNKPIKLSLIEEKQSQLLAIKGGANNPIKKEVWEEIYLISNPPYLGTRNQDSSQKQDKQQVLESIKNYKILDYIAIWFYKGTNYIRGNQNARLAFVTTNSITQGDQLSVFWPVIFKSVEINFAYTSFKWTNNAVNAAGVSVAIISLRNRSGAKKFIFTEGLKKEVENITANLTQGNDVFVHRRTTSISKLPKMSYGNHTGGDDTLFLSKKEKEDLLFEFPAATEFVRRLVGSNELNKGIERYCLWIEPDRLKIAEKISQIKSKIERRRNNFLNKEDDASKKLAERSFQFRDTNTAKSSQIVVPIVFSERRPYVVCGFFDKSVIIPNSAQALYDVDLWVFSLISSAMHMVWVRAVAGQLETRIRYSSVIVYNNFPVPVLSEEKKSELSSAARNILLVRENYTEKTLGEMYNPDKMPEDLCEAHYKNDLLVDSLYRQKPYENDEERLADLFKLYEQMITKEEK